MKRIPRIEDVSISLMFVLGVALIAIQGLLSYVMCIAINVHSIVSWCMFAVMFVGVSLVVAGVANAAANKKNGGGRGSWRHGYGDVPAVTVIVPVAVAAAIAVGLVAGSPMFSAHTYASRIAPEETTFDAMRDRLDINGIALMDTDSARMFGNRELGGLSDVVSQFDDDADYRQIVLDGVPTKVSPLRYTDFWRWFANRGTGTPGYVSVDPVRQNADYHRLEDIGGTGDGIVYSPSAHFGENIYRHLWLDDPTAVYGDARFELDDEGHPFYVTPTYRFGTLFGARDIDKVTVTDPTNGKVERYDPDDAPDWVDCIYDGDLIEEQYDDYGAYSGGFWNAVFSKSGCTKTNGDYGYIMIDGHIWIYTGVTSVNDDSSNIGFILSSERTKETYYLPMPAADESSAMSSAEGKVQQMGYAASFPSLVAIDGQPTYVGVLKDDGGVVRMYYMVNAASYNVVACADTLAAAKDAYENDMRDAGIGFSDDGEDMPKVTEGEDAEEEPKDTEFDTKVARVATADDGGSTYVYVSGEDGNLYRFRFADHPREAMGISEGSRLTGRASEADGVYEVTELGGGE